jgi:hypothetical protein
MIGERAALLRFGEANSIVAKVIDGEPLPEKSITWYEFCSDSFIGIDVIFRQVRTNYPQ